MTPFRHILFALLAILAMQAHAWEHGHDAAETSPEIQDSHCLLCQVSDDDWPVAPTYAATASIDGSHERLVLDPQNAAQRLNPVYSARAPPHADNSQI